jgi:hypothetical protein
VEPGVEPIEVTKSREVAPGSDVRILDRIACKLLVPDDQVGDRLQPSDRRVDQQREGVMIAPPRSFDDVSLVHGLPRSYVRSDASNTIGVVPPRTCRKSVVAA